MEFVVSVLTVQIALEVICYVYHNRLAALLCFISIFVFARRIGNIKNI